MLTAARSSLARVPSARWVALAVGLTSFAIYLATLTPGVSWADWGEGQAVPHTLGIMHPTGYPVFTLLGWAWSQLPIGSVAYRANVLSALEVSLALSVGTLILGHLRVRPVIAAAAMLAVGLAPTIWLKATRAEVQTLHLLFLALIVHRLFLWAEEGRPRDFLVLAAMTGLAFGNHMATLTVAPFIGAAAIWVGRRTLVRQPAVFAAAASVFVLALTPYLYLPIRASTGEPSWAGHLATIDGFLGWVTGSQFGSGAAILSLDAAVRAAETWPDWIRLVVTDATLVFLLAATIGALSLVRRRPGMVVLGFVLIVVNVCVYLNFLSWAERERYLVTSWFVLGLAAGVGLEQLVQLVVRIGGPRVAPVAWLALMLPIVLVPLHWSDVDQSENRSAEVMADTVFAALPPDAALLTYWDALTPLRYAQDVDGLRPDVLLLLDPVSAADQLSATRPVYLLRFFEADLEPLRGHYTLTDVATLNVAYGKVVAPHERPLIRADPIP